MHEKYTSICLDSGPMEQKNQTHGSIRIKQEEIVGELSLVACRVLALQADNLKLRRLFEVVGLRDGSFKVELMTTYVSSMEMADVCLPGALVWSLRTNSEFHLEVLDTHSANRLEWYALETENIGLVQLVGIELETIQDYSNIIQLLRHRFVLEDDNELLAAIPLQGLDIQLRQQRELSLGRRTFQYLMELPSFGRSRAKSGDLDLGGTHEGRDEGSSGWGPVARSSYGRLTIQVPEIEKELAGLWSGIYGPHGIEIINVSYTNVEIVGTKVLGDPNIPCGKASFRVRLSTESKQIPRQLQRIVDLNVGMDNDAGFIITRLYEGHGHIADDNFQNPQWVRGQLLVDKNGQIAFLWEDVNFIIPFQRLDLATLHRSEKDANQIL